MKNKENNKLFYCPDLLRVDWEKLYDLGIRLAMLDIDNTLEADGSTEPGERSFKIINAILEAGIQAVLVSNAKSGRGKHFADLLEIPYVGHAGKPSTVKVKEFLDKNDVIKDQAVMIGDQFFTDLLCARFLGVRMIWVERVSRKERWYIVVKRWLESVLAFFGMDPQKAEQIPLLKD